MAAIARHQDGHQQETPPPRRRVSLEEDLYYQEVMTSAPPRLSQSPASEPLAKVRSLGKHILESVAEDESLPQYSCSITAEGVFNMKMEIENTIKRAEDRKWTNRYLVLQGTALHIYHIKKDWGWGKTGKSGPHVSPDNPPWLRKAKLEKTYTLLYADVGIAADYQKRRYVIRIRAETDQFLISCIELPNFVRWLDALFAAINIAPAIDDRHFPRDQSIPRVARIRYFRGEMMERRNSVASDATGSSRPEPVVHHSAMTPRTRPRPQVASTPPRLPSQQPESSSAVGRVPDGPNTPIPTTLEPLPSRLSTTSYPNEAIVPETGKWRPQHQWTSAHDMVYAKLCYAVLLFRSPRKSNYIIMKGKRWFVDWTTGRMVRVLPPGYFEAEVTGPFQVWSAENRRI
ncbi:PH domain-containing protein [Pseudomassariella vexata]|uniref:PH domain-containing protein n=1 Tax=Pseudomassariella vexata TaxID=1141098 RepID=A0A1Y2EER4_9PEZI|nr:PH domain-containing protein [Pseudomassariella vexata]ORY69897.1 PH domain-containing protein [Pseudomassariella vexata]